MSTVEMIAAKALPERLQTEALHYVDFLLSREGAKTDAAEWAKLSGAQLEKHYGPGDDIYDKD